MTKILTSIFLLMSLASFGQFKESPMHDEALDLFYDEDFKGALNYYIEISEQPEYAEYAYYLDKVGDCYYHLNLNQNAKEYYFKCLKDSIRRFGRPFFAQRNACHKLTEIYLEESKFDSAFYYIKLADEQYRHIRIDNSGEFERKTLLNYKIARCLDGLEQLDSAIVYLTPYAFSTYDRVDPFIDSIEYVKIVDFYLSLVKIKYSNEEIKVELQSSLENTFYLKEPDVARNGNHPDNNYYNVICSVRVFGGIVTLIDGGYEANSWGGEPVEAFSKERLINEFENSVAYGLIMSK